MNIKLRFLQNPLALSAITLIVIVWSTVSFLAYQNKLLKIQEKHFEKNIPKSISESISTAPPFPFGSFSISSIPNWRKYSNSELNYSIEFPNDWNFSINDTYPENPIFYISKDKLSNWHECHRKTSCLVIQTNMGGRGGYMFMTKTRQSLYNQNNVSGIRTDILAYDGGVYSFFINIDEHIQRPLWKQGTIDIFPKIINEKFSETEMLHRTGQTSFDSRLDSIATDTEDLSLLSQILSTFKFTDNNHNNSLKCINAFANSKIELPNHSILNGTVSGQVFWPSEKLPIGIKVCAYNTLNYARYCTSEILNENPFYSLSIPEGNYYIFSLSADGLIGVDGMLTKNNDRYVDTDTAGSIISEAPLHIHVGANTTTENIDVGDHVIGKNTLSCPEVKNNK